MNLAKAIIFFADAVESGSRMWSNAYIPIDLARQSLREGRELQLEAALKEIPR